MYQNFSRFYMFIVSFNSPKKSRRAGAHVCVCVCVVEKPIDSTDPS